VSPAIDAAAATLSASAPDRLAHAWAVLDTVPDPEVPALSLRDLGVVREVNPAPGGDEGLEVVLTPTYSGCPATEVIAASVRQALEEQGLGPVTVRHRLAPPWTTDWISEAGLRKLREYGIAPPGRLGAQLAQPIRIRAANVACPRCGSNDTERLAAFGSTACKALYRCLECREPFEHFKPI
jgi:ring-1,2-phenylacetyl-CoA epoxidase subunit PaaD